MIVVIHGGTGKHGDKISGLQSLPPFLERGKLAKSSIGYRLSEAAISSAQIHDRKAATRRHRPTAKRSEVNPNRMVVWKDPLLDT